MGGCECSLCVDTSVHCDQVSQDSSLCYLHCTVCVLPSIPVMYVGQIGIHRTVLHTYPVRYVHRTDIWDRRVQQCTGESTKQS